MVPYSDEPQPERRRFPFVTVALILINIAVFAYMLSLGQDRAIRFVSAWAFVPAEFRAGRDLITLVTALFLHGGLLHIASNLLFLWIFGDNVEEQIGHVTYLLFYLAAGVTASLSFALIFPNISEPLVGASGAIAGVLAAYLFLFPRAMVRTFFFFGPFLGLGRVAAVLLIGFWFVLQVVQSVMSILAVAPQSNVAFVAHVGGFIFGLIITGVINEARDVSVEYRAGRALWSPSIRNLILLVIAISLLVLASQFLIAVGQILFGNLLRYLAAAGGIGLALLDGVARFNGERGLLGTRTRTNRFVGLLQIVAALSFIALLVVS